VDGALDAAKTAEAGLSAGVKGAGTARAGGLAPDGRGSRHEPRAGAHRGL